MNSMEHAWAMLPRVVAAHRSSPRSVQKLVNAAQEEWRNITQDHISIPKKLGVAKPTQMVQVEIRSIKNKVPFGIFPKNYLFVNFIFILDYCNV